jgi:integrase/recombinase XerC
MAHLSPQTLTRDEQRALLSITAPELRDHLIFSLALGTGLRLGELVGLDVGDVFFPSGFPRERIRVRAAIAKRGRVGDVFLPRALVPKLASFWKHKQGQRESTSPHAPLFCGLSRRRVSTRRVQVLFHEWQELAGFGRQYPFHSLRHSAVTQVYRSSRDLFLAQRFARHSSPLTTVIYTHASDDDLREGVRDLLC